MIKIDRFFDLETASWDQYVLGGVYSGHDKYFSTTDPDELFWDLVNTGGHVWAWNGGLFDFLWFLDLAKNHGVSCDIGLAGSKIIRIRCGALILRDACAVIPMKLKLASRMVGIEMSKDTGLPCVCGDECGGYCSITTNLPPHLLEILDEYLLKDCKIGFDVVEAVIEEATRCDYQLTGTVGGSSYGTARKMLDLKPAKWSSSHYRLARSAYFGGRTEVFQPSAAKGHAYDINSAYPAALVNTPLPVGEQLDCEPTKAARAFVRGKEGCYHARVEVPLEMFIPPLPVRLGQRVCFPVGPLVGTWTGLELREAIALGCDVEIRGGLVWSHSETILAPFMQHVWDRRRENKDNKAWYQWHKWIANSLTGKLAELPDKERVMMYPDMAKMKLCPGGLCSKKCASDSALHCGASKCCDRHCRGACGRWECIDDLGCIYSAPFHRISDCGHVHWAAYLTACARIQLARQLRADGRGGLSAIYCDTDSVFATEERTENIGPDLGQWGSDGPISEFFALAPKAYKYLLDGKWVVKAKGLSGIDRADFDRFVAGEAIRRDRGVMPLKSAIQAGGSLFVRKSLSRASHADGLHYGSRVLRDDGKTYPQTINELMAAKQTDERTEKR